MTLRRQRPTKRRVAYRRLAAISCSTSFRRVIPAATLARIVGGQEEPGPWLPHLAAFFTDLPLQVFVGFLEENGIAPRQAWRVLRRHLPDAGDLPSTAWLQDAVEP